MRAARSELRGRQQLVELVSEPLERLHVLRKEQVPWRRELGTDDVLERTVGSVTELIEHGDELEIAIQACVTQRISVV